MACFDRTRKVRGSFFLVENEILSKKVKDLPARTSENGGNIKLPEITPNQTLVAKRLHLLKSAPCSC